ncbi:MAG: hypothetical protein KQH67_07230 [Bacteroidetes bacterium]|jgi:hypothetical protein|nr:hypothetical protein [Bacteroidota bacterium]
MKWKRVRPRCRYIVDLPPVEVMKLIESQLRKSNDEVTGSILQHHAYLTIPEKNQHYWSPEFHITIEETETGSLVRGVIGPKPKVWTMFMFFYSAVVVLLAFGSAMGVSQWMLKMSAPWLWSIPVALLMYLGIYLAALYGQHLGHEQTILLQDYLKKCLDIPDQSC